MSASVRRETGTYLDRILTRTALDIEARKRSTDEHMLVELISSQPQPVDIAATLRRETVTVIAEYKRASPSKGVFLSVPDPETVVCEYVEGGAAMISCLTDEPFFQGTLDDLQRVAAIGRDAQPEIGVLRKDFIIDPFQIDEARAFGASCILLIVAALQDETLVELYRHARSIGLAVLVEIHDAVESRRAIDIGAEIIGINNRDLRTFEVDLGLTERLTPTLKNDVIVVGESGIRSRTDVERLAAAGVDAVLVGESLIRQTDRPGATRALTGVAKPV